MTMALIIMPVIIAYYFCRDYPGRGNSPENASFAALAVALMWTPLYLGVRDLFLHYKNVLNIVLLFIFSLLVVVVTIGNPKF
ncbi:hypothetical protein NT6N_24680 [Oceaniferula spumae]|uniref:Uncharacterized protein n=2 Tax=Oceaniferula spumae TaxID=2979115 RepID=A0AAT9FN93_9BACT